MQARPGLSAPTFNTFSYVVGRAAPCFARLGSSAARTKSDHRAAGGPVREGSGGQPMKAGRRYGCPLSPFNCGTDRKPTAMRFQPLIATISSVNATCSFWLK